MFLLITSCASKNVYQINGVPVPDKVIQAKVFALEMTVTYTLSKSFTIKEDDEAYRSFEHLSLFKEDYHKIKEGETLLMKLSVFNPKKSHYIIEQHSIVEGGETYSIEVYDGNLSRNSIEFRLPDRGSEKVVFYYDVYNEKGNLVYQSFKARYIIEG